MAATDSRGDGQQAGKPGPAGQSEPSERRSFLGAALGILSAALTVLIGAPAIGFIGHPVRRDTVSRGKGFVPVGNLSAFPPGKPMRVEVKASMVDAWNRFEDVKVGAIWLVRNADNSVVALSAVCPHLGCAIDYVPDKARFECPCHSSVFAPDGSQVTGPSPRDMDPLPTRVDGETVLVEYKRFKTERADRVEV